MREFSFFRNNWGVDSRDFGGETVEITDDEVEVGIVGFQFGENFVEVGGKEEGFKGRRG